MKNTEFVITLSEKNQEDAIREASLKIKLVFPNYISHLIILFTSHYNPSNILKTVNLILKPRKVLGIQAPLLIFEGRVLQKGIIICCINKKEMCSKEIFLKHKESQKIESLLRASFKELKKQSSCFLSFLSPQITPSSYIDGIRLSLGKVFNLYGGGYVNKYSSSNYQIVNDTVAEGSINMAIEGLRISSLKLRGYLPLGKLFTITKTTNDKRIIIEINNQPAVNIYKHYLEKKFEIFMKNHLFAFYPLEIKSNGKAQLVNIIDCLEDGSLICLEEIEEKAQGHIMFFDSTFLFNNLENKLDSIRNKEPGLVFIINTLMRKKILKDMSIEEIKLITQILGDEVKTFGIYSDYSFFSDEEKGDINIEAGNLLITLWQ